MVAEIPLKHGLVALVDDEDYERVTQLTWWVSWGRYGEPYVCHSQRVGRRIFHTFLHNFVLSLPPGASADHINYDTLDCQKHNLRPATRAQQAAHRRRFRNNTSGYIGVYPRRNKFRAVVANKQVGTYPTAEEAARARDAAAIAQYGEFATLNFPPS